MAGEGYIHEMMRCIDIVAVMLSRLKVMGESAERREDLTKIRTPPPLEERS